MLANINLNANEITMIVLIYTFSSIFHFSQSACLETSLSSIQKWFPKWCVYVCTYILCMYSLSNQFCKTFLYMHLCTDVFYQHMHFLPSYASFYQKQGLLCTNFWNLLNSANAMTFVKTVYITASRLHLFVPALYF